MKSNLFPASPETQKGKKLKDQPEVTVIRKQEKAMTAAFPTPEEELKFKVSIRVYGKDDSRKESHSFILDDHFTGISSVIGDVTVNIRTTTFNQLRPILEMNRANEMNKRSMLFQEALFIMDRLPNVYNRPRGDLRKYRFGFLHKQNLTDFRLISEADEDKPIAELIGVVDFFSYDVCIVPLSQLPY
eukprot:gene9920-10777_t